MRFLIGIVLAPLFAAVARADEVVENDNVFVGKTVCRRRGDNGNTVVAVRETSVARVADAAVAVDVLARTRLPAAEPPAGASCL